MIGLPVIGALLESVGTILEKKVLRRNGLKSTNYTVYEFFAIVVAMSTFVWAFWRVDAEALQFWNLMRFALIVVISVAANLFIFYSLKREKVSEFEPIWLMQSIFVIILAFIFYSSERNWISFVLGIIASLALILAHVKKHHLVFDKYNISAVLGSLLFAIELVISKPILYLYNPFAFYFLRCFFILIICYALFRPNGKDLNRGYSLIILSIGLIWAFYRAIIYWGYENMGIISTTLLFILSAVFTFLFAAIFLKEKPTIRQIVSAIVIVICVVLSIFWK